jgi:hypothetical protein
VVCIFQQSTGWVYRKPHPEWLQESTLQYNVTFVSQPNNHLAMDGNVQVSTEIGHWWKVLPKQGAHVLVMLRGLPGVPCIELGVGWSQGHLSFMCPCSQGLAVHLPWLGFLELFPGQGKGLAFLKGLSARTQASLRPVIPHPALSRSSVCWEDGQWGPPTGRLATGAFPGHEGRGQ